MDPTARNTRTSVAHHTHAEGVQDHSHPACSMVIPTVCVSTVC
jgi:hypothetical protein